MKKWNTVPPVTDRVAECIALVEAQPGIRRNELARLMGCSPRTAGHHVWVASQHGRIRATGVGRYAGWVKA